MSLLQIIGLVSAIVAITIVSLRLAGVLGLNASVTRGHPKCPHCGGDL